MNSKKYVSKLSIIDFKTQKTIFSDAKYIIPLYQRAFAWGDNEIGQLLEDIKDFTTQEYFLGSLIVSEKDGKFEVIDGQQRLTAIFLLLKILDIDFGEDKLSYECREKSNFTLNHLNELIDESNIESKLIFGDEIEQTLIFGAEYLKLELKKFSEDERKKFLKNLSKVKIYRILVPEHTDLNRYFEIMNVRGEQLEQHDILKAQLMEPLSNDEKHQFALIWDACRDMTGYVQMHFYDIKERELVFGKSWEELLEENIDKLSTKNDLTKQANIKDIISKGGDIKNSSSWAEEGRVRFESIIDFRYFLLHVLNVFVEKEKISIELPYLLDDKNLLKVFRDARNASLFAEKSTFSLKFMKYLLKCRFLFDKYIIKREYKNDNDDGYWSLKELKIQRHEKKTYFVNTEFKETNEKVNRYKPRSQTNLMLQSCLRVSYTSPKVMHWITELLLWLFEDNNLKKLSFFQEKIEEIIQVPVKKFLEEKNFNQGVNTPHIVLNYLDYLLWKKSMQPFTFEFRNSVEHWYPQHPSEQSIPLWDEVDKFGNLCIIQRNINSKFSNLSPFSKKNTYEKAIEKGSLKLRIMSEATTNDEEWRNSICDKHQNEMIEILSKACKI